MTEDLKWPVPDVWANLSEASERLGMFRRTIRPLVVSEFASTLPGIAGPTCTRAGDMLLIRRDALDALANIPYVDDLGVALLSRFAPLPAEGRGWHANSSREQTQQLLGSDIQFRNLPKWIGFPMIGHVSGFVVTAGIITEASYNPETMLGSATLDFTSPEATRFLGHRFPAPQGAPVSMT